MEYLEQLAAFSLLNKVSMVMWMRFVSAQHQVEYLQQLAGFSLLTKVSVEMWEGFFSAQQQVVYLEQMRDESRNLCKNVTL
jgi:hypothetical protein